MSVHKIVEGLACYAKHLCRLKYREAMKGEAVGTDRFSGVFWF